MQYYCVCDSYNSTAYNYVCYDTLECADICKNYCTELYALTTTDSRECDIIDNDKISKQLFRAQKKHFQFKRNMIAILLYIAYITNHPFAITYAIIILARYLLSVI